MSYPFNLRFLVGRLLVDDNIEEKVCVVENETDDEDKDDKEPNEIWSSDELDNKHIEDTIGLLEFKIGANQSTYNPEFRILRTENYNWTLSLRDGIKDSLQALNDSYSSPTYPNPTYRLYYILSSRIPPGIISGISKRFGKNLLQQISTMKLSKDKIFWCILLKPKNTKRKTVKDIFADDSNFLKEKLQFDVLGESLSTNCAEIEFVF
jgi:hypothetical protein